MGLFSVVLVLFSSHILCVFSFALILHIPFSFLYSSVSAKPFLAQENAIYLEWFIHGMYFALNLLKLSAFTSNHAKHQGNKVFSFLRNTIFRYVKWKLHEYSFIIYQWSWDIKARRFPNETKYGQQRIHKALVTCRSHSAVKTTISIISLKCQAKAQRTKWEQGFSKAILKSGDRVRGRVFD